MSAGLTARRLILQQLTAVSKHFPLRTGLSVGAPAGVRTASHGRWISFFIRPENDRNTFTLMTEEEIDLLKKCQEVDGDEGRVILSTRPTHNALKAIGGSMLNITLSFLVSPLLALSVSLESIRRQGMGPIAFITAPAAGLLWGGIFMAIAWYAAVQQILLCCINTLRAPLMYLLYPGRCWNELSCTYEYPLGNVHDAHPLLAFQASPDKMFERAMKRETTRKRDKRGAKYTKTGKHDSPVDDDYYATLGVPRDATLQQIKEAYNRLVLKVHPDKNPHQSAATEFDAITKAYRVLSNVERRRKYDMGGKSGVDDIGKKKREAVRALFGGNTLHLLVGDVKTGSFSQRVIDGLDWNQEELCVLRQRTHERARDELLTNYLNYLMSAKQGKNTTDLTEMRRRLQRLTNTGLAREVLFAVGHEYKRVLLYSKASGPLERLGLYVNTIAPHRSRRRLDKWRHFSRIRQHTLKDSASMVDLAWYTSVEELESTARIVATSVLLDPRMAEEERRHRSEALQVLSESFIACGQPYKGANKQTMDALMNSLRDYHQQKRCEND